MTNINRIIVVFCITLILTSCTKKNNQRPFVGEFIHCIIDTTQVNWNNNPDSVFSQITPSLSLQQVLDNFFNVGFTNYSTVFGIRQNNGYPKIYFNLQYNNITGNYPLGNLLYFTSPTTYGIRNSQASTVNITVLGNHGTGFIEGNFTTQIIIPPSNIAKTLTCTFKAPRPL